MTKLQRDEVDEAKFMNIEELEKKLLPRYIEYITPYLTKQTI